MQCRIAIARHHVCCVVVATTLNIVLARHHVCYFIVATTLNIVANTLNLILATCDLHRHASCYVVCVYGAHLQSGTSTSGSATTGSSSHGGAGFANHHVDRYR